MPNEKSHAQKNTQCMMSTLQCFETKKTYQK